MSTTGNLFGAYRDNDTFIRIDPITGAGGLPVVHFGFKGGAVTNFASMLLDGSYLKVSATTSLQFAIGQAWLRGGSAGGSGGVNITVPSDVTVKINGEPIATRDWAQHNVIAKFG